MLFKFIDKFFLFVLGLIFIIFHRQIGKYAIEHRKKLFGKFLPEFMFNEAILKLTQIMFLLIGLLFFIVELAKFI